jgi:hypothetical protein
MTDVIYTPPVNIGNAFSPDGASLNLDALLANNCRLSFPKLPNVQFWLQDVKLPEIEVPEVGQSTRYVDVKQIGEKVIYRPFSCSFVVDKFLVNYISIFAWMKAITSQGSLVGNATGNSVDTPVLIVGTTPIFEFVDAWPTLVGGLVFSNASSQFVKCDLTINYDYLNIVGSSNPDLNYSKSTQ